MKKIERPDFRIFKSDEVPTVIQWRDFNLWFDMNLKDCYVVREDELVRVSGTECPRGWCFDSFKDDSDTHQAYLIKSSIEEIKKCEHNALKRLDKFSVFSEYECQHCGAKLKPTGWTEVEG